MSTYHPPDLMSSDNCRGLLLGNVRLVSRIAATLPEPTIAGKRGCIRAEQHEAIAERSAQRQAVNSPPSARMRSKPKNG